MRHKLCCAYLILILLFVVSLMSHAKIVFTSKQVGDTSSHIYVMDDDGSNVRRVTNSLDYDRLPSWFPDGESILFERDLSRGNGTVQNAVFYIIDATGENERLFMDNHRTDTNPRASPDGNRIAFSSQREKDWDIYVLDLESGDMKNLTKNPGGFGEAWSFRLDWSPDGSQIVYEHEGGDDGDNFWIMNAKNGSGKKRITPIPEGITSRGIPRWSLSGRYIMYTERVWDVNDPFGGPPLVAHLIIQNVRGGKREIHNFPKTFVVVVGSWMGDDHTVLLTIKDNADPNPKYDIYRYDLVSRQLTNLTNLPRGGALYPHWIAGSLAVSPQGKLPTLWGEKKQGH